jgi:hypothetical protein
VRRGLQLSPCGKERHMSQTELRRKLCAFDKTGLFFRMLTRY